MGEYIMGIYTYSNIYMCLFSFGNRLWWIQIMEVFSMMIYFTNKNLFIICLPYPIRYLLEVFHLQYISLLERFKYWDSS